MPLDAVCLQAVAAELRPQLLGIRIDRVQQPSRDQVILLLRGNKRLLLNAGASSPRIQLTAVTRDNPAEPPMFCMLLRKHLVGARVAEIVQPGLERLLELKLDITDEFGRPGQRTLVLEAMGRHSNLILLDGEGRIIDCLRRVDAEMSPNRQVLPGLFYELPPGRNQCALTDITQERFFEALDGANPERRMDDFLLDTLFGVSPLIAREIVYRATGATDSRLLELDAGGRRRFWGEVAALQQRIAEGAFCPVCLKKDGRGTDFTYLPIRQYGGAVEAEEYPDFSSLMDAFYEARERQERIRQKGADLIRTATTARDRMRRKLAQQRKDYAATQDREQLRLCGELITANLYRMERGLTRFAADNYYDGTQLTIQLDPLLTPQENAAKYYKRYNKAKTAEKYLREQMEITARDEAYLDSVLEEIGLAETEQDFLDIRNELRDSGFLRRSGKEKKELKRASKPREFRTSGGLRVLVGRNNRQNDKLTLKDADYRDIWLHTQKIHGSHAILCTEGLEPSEEDIREAAVIAAYYSQARESGSTPVDYTQVKYVKKPAGARPGMVIYSVYHTVYVTPDEKLVNERAVK